MRLRFGSPSPNFNFIGVEVWNYSPKPSKFVILPQRAYPLSNFERNSARESYLSYASVRQIVSLSVQRFAIRPQNCRKFEFFTYDKGGGTCFCPCLFVCLYVCLLARLLKNACMDLDEMLRVDRCRDIDELINF